MQMCTPVLLTSGILSMEGNVLQQTIPNFSNSPGTFFKILAITASAIFVAAVQQKVVLLPLKRILEMFVAALRALPRDLRWIRCIGAGVARPPESTWISAHGDVETQPMSRPQPYSPPRRTTMTTAGTLGDAELPMRPRRVRLHGAHLRSNTS